MKKPDCSQIQPLLPLGDEHLLYICPILLVLIVGPVLPFVALLEFKFLSRFEVSFFELPSAQQYTDFGKGPYHNFQVYYAQNACRQNHLTPHPL